MTKIPETDNANTSRVEGSIFDMVIDGKKLGDMTREDLLKIAEKERLLGEIAAARAALARNELDRREANGDA